jgi:Ca-activated chloride channel family protein
MSGLLEHFRFSQPAWLLLLPLLAPLLALRRGRGASAAVRFPNLPLLEGLGKQVRKTSGSLAIPLLLAATFLAILAMARPVWREQFQTRSASGIDILIALDLSLSMDIADFEYRGESQKRIDAAKAVVEDFINRRPDDRIGLVAFAGRPRGASPITLDHDWLRGALRDLRLNDQFNRGTIREQGTAIGSAISEAAIRLVARDAKSRVIVLITDGASNSGKISPIAAAELAKDLGIRIYTVAIGTKEGRVDRSIMRYPYQEFDLPTLRRIAEITGAEHYWAQDLESLRETFSTIDRLEKTEVRSFTTSEDKEWFPWLLIPSLAAALGAALLFVRSPLT